MDIYWLGHAAFRLRSTTTGLSIITDPYAASSGLGMQIDSRQIVDVVGVTVSHDDAMHNNSVDLGGDARVFNTAPASTNSRVLPIRAVMTGLPEGIPRSQRNVAYTIAIDGISVCHLGNIARPLTAQQTDLIGPADVVLAPAGGEERNLLSYRAINQTAQQLDARWLIPHALSRAGRIIRDRAGGSQRVSARTRGGRWVVATAGADAGYPEQPAAVLADRFAHPRKSGHADTL